MICIHGAECQGNSHRHLISTQGLTKNPSPKESQKVDEFKRIH